MQQLKEAVKPLDNSKVHNILVLLVELSLNKLGNQCKLRVSTNRTATYM